MSGRDALARCSRSRLLARALGARTPAATAARPVRPPPSAIEASVEVTEAPRRGRRLAARPPGRRSFATSSGTPRGVRSKRCPESERARPEVRYVRARVALARGDAAAALPLLDGLEAALPLLAGRHRAAPRTRRSSSSGPFAEAGGLVLRALVARRAARRGARVREGEGPAARARRRRAGAGRREADARAGGRGARAARPHRRAPRATPSAPTRAGWRPRARTSPAAADALALVARVDPSHPLTAQELVVRARVLSDAGRTDDALHAHRPGCGRARRQLADATSIARARAAWRSTTRAGAGCEAAKVLSECAGTGGPHAAEDAFHAARALSRADRDEEAIRGYEDVRAALPEVDVGGAGGVLRALPADAARRVEGVRPRLRRVPARPRARRGRRRRAARRRALQAARRATPSRARVAFEHLVEDEPDPHRQRAHGRHGGAGGAPRRRPHARRRALDRRRALAAALVARARGPRAARGGRRSRSAGHRSRGAVAEPPAPLVVAVPPPADMLHRLGLDADAELALREREAAVTGGAGAARTGGALHGATASSVARGGATRSPSRSRPRSSPRRPGARTRWAWECAFPSPYADEVRAAEAAEKLPAGLLWAVMRQESGFDPDAVSPARAVGLMQLLPETARPIAEELSLPHDDARLTSPPYAIRVGARYAAQAARPVPRRRRARRGRLQRRRRIGRALALARAGHAARHLRRAHPLQGDARLRRRASWETSRATATSRGARRASRVSSSS